MSAYGNHPVPRARWTARNNTATDPMNAATKPLNVNQRTQPRRLVVLVELGLLPLPLGNLFIRAVSLSGPNW